MASDFPEDTKKITVRIFTEIVEVSAEVRKQLRDMLQNFIRNYVIPRLVPGENWLSSEKDFVFEDNTMQDVCEKCVEAAAFSLGKQIMNPLLHDVVQ